MPTLPWLRRRVHSERPESTGRIRRWIPNPLAAIASVLLLLLFGAKLLFPLAGTSHSAFPSIDGIECERGERLNYHVHAHLALFIEGRQMDVPAGIGITDRCLYWLHTHAADGIIHIEAPFRRGFTLGQFSPCGANRWDEQHS